jgi:CDP-glucose 4,6-dehydratase
MTKTGNSPAFGNIYSGKKVFLTGHTGFKGAWLGEWLLALGAEVTGYSIDCQEPSLFDQLKLANRLRDLRGDVRDLDTVSNTVSQLEPDFVFHLAAQPLVRESYVDPVGTFTTNVTGTVNVMDALRRISNRCAAVMVTTDKCYHNRETPHAYSESDPLGGHDPYSASKAAAEIAIDSYRKSFFSDSHPVALGSARAGNVIGGGDWADDRLVPDCIRALRRGEKICVRNPHATRPWQHVLEPLSGYLTLGAAIWQSADQTGPQSSQRETVSSAFNFGPHPESNRTVAHVVGEILKHWPGQWIDQKHPDAPHEAGLLDLNIEKAERILGWRPVWSFERGIDRTVSWYRAIAEKSDPSMLTRQQIAEYQQDAAVLGLHWAAK